MASPTHTLPPLTPGPPPQPDAVPPSDTPAQAEALALPAHHDEPAATAQVSTPPPIPAQSVTVVHAPAPAAATGRGRFVIGGAILGLIAGLAAGYDHFQRQPGEYESAARFRVADAGAEANAVRSPAVLDRAARRLDQQKPFGVAPPESIADRVAYLTNHLATIADADLTVTFRGPNPADTARYLRAVVEAYQTEVAARPVPAPAPVPARVAPKSPPPAPSPVADLAKLDAERAAMTAKLHAVTTEDVHALQTRLVADRAGLVQLLATLRGVEDDLAALPAPAAPESPAADPALERRLAALREKKAELGQRLGVEHRDMVALDEQIQFVSTRLAPVPPPRPADPSAPRRAELQAARAAAAGRGATLHEALARDEKTVYAAAPLRAELDRLAAPPKAETRPVTKTPDAPVAAAPVPPPAPTVEAIGAPGEGVRIAPQMYRSLISGGLLGLAGGAGLGLLVSLLAALGGRATRPSPRPSAKPPLAAVRPRPARAPKVKLPDPQLGVALLGQIPRIRTDLPVEKKSSERWDPSLVCFTRPSGDEAVAFRAARRELLAALQFRGHQVIPVTSPDDGDGKSTVAANLAVSLAQSGKRVILVDCDFRATRMQQLFHLIRLGDSLKSVMAADVDLRLAVRACEVANLFLLPAGRGEMDALDLLTRPKFRELMADLRAAYEYVILDAPPTAREAELAAIGGYSDGVVLVVRPGPDARGRTDRATSEVARAGTRVIGAITNAAPAASDKERTVAAQSPS